MNVALARLWSYLITVWVGHFAGPNSFKGRQMGKQARARDVQIFKNVPDMDVQTAKCSVWDSKEHLRYLNLVGRLPAYSHSGRCGLPHRQPTDRFDTVVACCNLPPSVFGNTFIFTQTFQSFFNFRNLCNSFRNSNFTIL